MNKPETNLHRRVELLLKKHFTGNSIDYKQVFSMALRAAGDAKFTSVASLVSMWLFRIVMGYVFGVTLGFGVIGVWAAMVAEWGVRALIFTLRLRGDKWYKHKLV